MLFFYNTIEENDVFQTTGTVTLYGAAVSRLKIRLPGIVQRIQAATDCPGKCRGPCQDDGDPRLILFYLLDDAPYGKNFIQVLAVEEGLVLIRQPDQIACIDMDGCFDGYGREGIRDMKEISIQEQDCDKGKEDYPAISDSFFHVRAHALTYVKILRMDLSQLTPDPGSIVSPGLTKCSLPPGSSAMRIIPLLSMPRILRGARFATTTTCLPMISAGLK